MPGGPAGRAPADTTEDTVNTVKTGKKIRKTVTILALAALLLVGSFFRAPLEAYAAVDNSAVSGVHQEGDVDTFLRDAPIATIKIETDRIRPAYATLDLIQSDKFKVATSADIPSGVSGANDLIGAVCYTGSVASFSDNFIPGDCFSYRFSEAAILPDGSTADVLFTISNVHIFTTASSGYTGPFSVAKLRDTGLNLFVENTLIDGGAINNRYGLVFDANIKVVDRTSGKPVDGTFTYSTYDINVSRYNNNNFKAIYDSEAHMHFSEQVQIVSGALSDAFLPLDGYEVFAHAPAYGATYSNGLLISPPNTDSVSSDARNNYKSGFVVLADAYKGLTVQMTAAGGGGGTSSNRRTINTILFTPLNKFHRVITSTGIGGTIQTTTVGNRDGTLKDGGIVIDPGTFYVPRHKTVTFTMTPERGRYLGKLILDGRDEVFPTPVYGSNGHILYYTYVLEDDDGITMDHKLEVVWTSLMIIRRPEAETADGAPGNDPNQDFWYTVEGRDHNNKIVTLDVCIPAGEREVTVSAVTIGMDYTVTERDEWSWRYGAPVLDPANSSVNAAAIPGGATITIVEGKENNVLTFTRPRTSNDWLGDTRQQDNIFTRVVTDYDTFHDWTELFDFKTENTGMIWSSKSVTDHDSYTVGTLGYTPLTVSKTPGSDFLIDFALMSSTVTEHTYNATTNTPLDIVFVVDQSESMSTRRYDITNIKEVSRYQTNYEYFQQWNNGKGTQFYAHIPDSEYPWQKLIAMEHTGAFLGVFGRYTYTFEHTTVQTNPSLGNPLDLPSFFPLWTGVVDDGRTRMDDVKDALTDFLHTMDLYDVNARISLVGFGNTNTGDAPDLNGTGFYSGSSVTPYSDNTADYRSALLNVTNAEQFADLQAAVDALEAKTGAHSYIDLGMEMAQKILYHSTGSRKRVVIVLTDGQPGSAPASGYYTAGAAYGQSGDAEAVETNALASANTVKTPDGTRYGAEIYTIGYFPGADAASSGSATGQDIAARTNSFLQRLSSNNGTPQDSGYYFAAEDADDVSDALAALARKLTLSDYTQGHPVSSGGSMDQGYVTYTDKLGDYMEVDELNAIIIHETVYRPVSFDEATGAYTFAADAEAVSDITGDPVALNEIKVKVTRGASLREGDKIEIKVPSVLIPLRELYVNHVNGQYMMSVERDRPLHAMYSVSMKDRIRTFLEQQQPLDALGADQADWLSYAAANKATDGKTVAFHANHWSGGDNGDATVTFTPSENNHFYYFLNDTPLWTEDHRYATETDLNDLKLENYHYHVYHYEFDDPRLSEGSVPDVGVDYKARYISDTGDARKECVVHGVPVFDKSLLKWHDEGDGTGYWFIPKGTPKYAHAQTLFADKVENMSDTATTRYREDPAVDSENKITLITERLGNNGTIYFGYSA